MKIIADPQSRQYEVTYLIPASFSDAERKAVDDSVAALVKKHKGEVESSKDWGRKKLAYVINHLGKKYDEAHYTHQVVVFEPKNVPPFEKDMYLEERIIRHLVVKVDPKEKSATTQEKTEEKN
jgi:small subunit ribosomal protein S6